MCLISFAFFGLFLFIFISFLKRDLDFSFYQAEWLHWDKLSESFISFLH